MALPSSGPLSINDIRVELGASSTNQSLGTFSDTAGFASPDAITDFYGYSNVTLTSFYLTTSTSKFSDDVCGVVTTVNLWHNGSNTLPGNGDTVYQNSSGTLTATWVSYKGFSTTFNGNAISAGIVNGSGVIQTATLCT